MGEDDRPEPRPKVEPHAELRQAAIAMFEMFTALMDSGFTEYQALVILGHAFKAGGNRDND